MAHSCVLIWLIHTVHGLLHLPVYSFECVITHSHMTWLIRMCAMTHSYVRHQSFICVPWLIHMCDMTHAHATWLVRTVRGLLHMFVYFIRMCYDALICDMTHSYVRHDSFICAPWLIHMCAVTHWLIHTVHGLLHLLVYLFDLLLKTIDVKRDQHTCEKSPIIMWKGPNTREKEKTYNSRLNKKTD